MSYDVQSLEPTIRAILSAPGVDLSTISAKRVRKQLMEEDQALTSDFVKDNKGELDSLIAQVFEEVSSAQRDSDEDTQPAKRKKGDDDEVAEGSAANAKKKKKAGQEASDAKLARKLSSEINGRATRGAGKSRSNGAAKKGGRSKKSASTVDSDDGGDGEGGKKKRKGGGGFGKEYHLSEPLSALLQVEKMSRPQVVKGLWDHIKGNGLQNPSNKREIMCDASMKAVFNVDKINMFEMNKVLGQHLHEPES